MTYAASPLTDAIVALLTGAGIPTGDGAQPDGTGWASIMGASSFAGYVVVHAIPGGPLDGPIGAPEDDASPIYQVSAYGATRSQCDQIADHARAVMLASSVAVTGRRVARMRLDFLGGATRFDEPQPPVWQNADRFQAITTPA